MKNKSFTSKSAKSFKPSSGKASGKPADNPFDKFANPRKKHDVVNRRVKGEDRNVGRARGKAVDSRQKRLIEDYKASKKSNTFTDKRFGENDPSMSLEEKNFLRLQKEKQRSSKKYSSIFNLDDDEDNEVLTHKGSALGLSNISDGIDSDGEEDNNLNRDVVSSMHFGGGLVRKQGGGDSGSAGAGAARPNNRLEALQEIVMKSKLHKLEKKESKEAQEDERERLDKEFEELVGGSVIKYRPNKRDPDYKSDDEDDVADKDKGGKAAKAASAEKRVLDEYDTAMRSMAFEARVQPSDRTKSDEELAVEAREKLEELEKARMARMRAGHVGGRAGGVGEEDSALIDTALNGAAVGVGGKRKALTDDEDTTYSDYAIENQKRIQQKLQKLRAKSRASKEGDDDEEEDEEEDDWEDEEGEGAEDEEEEDDWEDEDGEEGEGSDEDDDDSDDEEEEEPYNPLKSKAKKAETPAPKAKSSSKSISKATTPEVPANTSGVNDNMPHNLTCPRSIEAFDELVQQYVHNAADMNALVERILIWNSVKLPGQQGHTNRGAMHNFLEVLIRHFIRVGDSLGCCAGAGGAAGAEAEEDAPQEADVLQQLNFLTRCIHQLTADIAPSSISLWRKVVRVHFTALLQKKLRDYQRGVDVGSCYPSLGRLLLLQLLGRVFSVSDYYHGIVTPLMLFMCQCLVQCPVNTPRDVASGLFLCSLLQDFTAETGRLVPEVLFYARSVLCVYRPSAPAAPTGKASKAAAAAAAVASPSTSLLCNINQRGLAWLRTSASEHSSSSGGSAAVDWRCFGLIKSCKFSAESTDVPAGVLQQWGNSLLGAAYSICESVVERFADSVAFPELVHLLQMDLRALRPQDAPALSTSTQQRHMALLDRIVRTGVLPTAFPAGSAPPTATPLTRAPLAHRVVGKYVINTLTPRYDMSYAMGKGDPNNPNKQAALAKTLGKQLKRETKGAMRELRRDADFVEQEKFTAETRKKDALRAERNKNWAELEQEQGAINLQVKLGKGDLIKGGGKNGVKKSNRAR